MRGSGHAFIVRSPLDVRVNNVRRVLNAWHELTPPGHAPAGPPPKKARGKKESPASSSDAGLMTMATPYSRTASRGTTIGAAAFHGRVRDGDGWVHRALGHQARGPRPAPRAGAKGRGTRRPGGSGGTKAFPDSCT